MRGKQQPVADRFWDKVNKTDSCWLWTGSVNIAGYGQVRGDTGKNERAHRVAYAMLIGNIPTGLTLDHTCGVRKCVNPQHLEPVTTEENTSRHHRKRGQYCRRGHERTEENTYFPRGQGPKCKVCRAERRSKEGRRTLDENVLWSMLQQPYF